MQNVISGQGQARRRACLPLPICRIRLPVGEHRPGFGDRRGDDPIGPVMFTECFTPSGCIA